MFGYLWYSPSLLPFFFRCPLVIGVLFLIKSIWHCPRHSIKAPSVLGYFFCQGRRKISLNSTLASGSTFEALVSFFHLFVGTFVVPVSHLRFWVLTHLTAHFTGNPHLPDPFLLSASSLWTEVEPSPADSPAASPFCLSVAVMVEARWGEPYIKHNFVANLRLHWGCFGGRASLHVGGNCWAPVQARHRLVDKSHRGTALHGPPLT